MKFNWTARKGRSERATKKGKKHYSQHISHCSLWISRNFHKQLLSLCLPFRMPCAHRRQPMCPSAFHHRHTTFTQKGARAHFSFPQLFSRRSFRCTLVCMPLYPSRSQSLTHPLSLSPFVCEWVWIWEIVVYLCVSRARFGSFLQSKIARLLSFFFIRSLCVFFFTHCCSERSSDSSYKARICTRWVCSFYDQSVAEKNASSIFGKVFKQLAQAHFHWNLWQMHWNRKFWPSVIFFIMKKNRERERNRCCESNEMNRQANEHWTIYWTNGKRTQYTYTDTTHVQTKTDFTVRLMEIQHGFAHFYIKTLSLSFARSPCILVVK